MNTRFVKYAGFSLMEVLFAIVILTLGLVFVAAQFPVGLHNSRLIYDKTFSDINNNNAQIQIKLSIQGIANEYRNVINDPNMTLDYRDTQIHPLVRPNLLANTVDLPRPTLVQDDLEHYGFHLRTNTLITDALPEAPIWPFMARNFIPSEYPISPIGGYDRDTTFYIGDIGMIMAPAVDEYDPDVQKQLPPGFNHNDDNHLRDYLHPAMLNVSMNHRSYHWNALYQLLNFNAGDRYRFFIFTLRNNRTDLRYAVQAPVDIIDGHLNPAAQEYDRYLPVPWRIDLNPPFDTAGFDAGNDVLLVAPALDVLRVGTILVDDDQEDFDYGTGFTNSTPWRDNGYTYEIIDITRIDENNATIRLNRPLSDHLKFVWFFPPAYNREEGRFNQQQPVINMATKIMEF